jgi:hypothetical protein
VARSSKSATRETLAADAMHMREQATLLPPGRLRDELLRKARQTEAAAHAGDWVESAGLGAPRRTLMTMLLDNPCDLP